MSQSAPVQGADQRTYASTIDTEVAVGNVAFLPEFLRRRYLLEHEKYRAFWDVHVRSNTAPPALAYKVAYPHKNQYVEVRVEASAPIRVRFTLSDAAIPTTFIDQLYEDLFLMVQLFEEEMRASTLYLAFMPGERIVPKGEAASWRIRFFTDSMIPLYLTLLALTFLFFWVFGDYAPLIYVALSFALALTAGKLVARSGNWTITPQHPEILLLQYHLPPYRFEAFRERHAQHLSAIRKEIYDATLARQQPITCETAGAVFARYGIPCHPGEFSVKQVNLWALVEQAARRFDLPRPTIVVANNLLPNAAAAGPTPQLGTILITTGLLTQLEDDELVNVIGHEFSHLKHHDSLVMFGLSTAEYLLRIYFLWPYLFTLGLTSYGLYSLVSLSVIYLVGKFIEGRADLDAAKRIGRPQVLAEALKKIAFRRLFPLVKREPAFRGYRRIEWLQLEPHPPVYFRIARLTAVTKPDQITRPLLTSIKDSLRGFLRA